MKGIAVNELSEIENKDLFLVITTSSCLYMVVDNITNICLSFSTLESVEDIVPNTLVFDNVKAYLLSNHFTTLPSAIFEESKSRDYLDFTCGTNEESTIKIDHIVSEKKVLVWELKKDLKDQLTHLYSGVEFHNLSSSFISLNLIFSNSIQTFFFEDKLLVKVIKDNQLQLVNIFDIKTIEDALYYHILMLQNIELEESQVNLIVGGKYRKLEEFINKVSKYFSKVSRLINNGIDNSDNQLYIREILKVIN